MLPIYKQDRDYLFLLPKCIFNDFVREEILNCPVLTKVEVHGYTLKSKCQTFEFIRTQDGFKFNLEKSSEGSRLILWKYAHLLKTMTLNDHIFFNFVDTEFYYKPIFQLKTKKANVIIAPRRCKEGKIDWQPALYFNKNGLRTEKEIVQTLNDLLC